MTLLPLYIPVRTFYNGGGSIPLHSPLYDSMNRFMGLFIAQVTTDMFVLKMGVVDDYTYEEVSTDILYVKTMIKQDKFSELEIV